MNELQNNVYARFDNVEEMKLKSSRCFEIRVKSLGKMCCFHELSLLWLIMVVYHQIKVIDRCCISSSDHWPKMLTLLTDQDQYPAMGVTLPKLSLEIIWLSWCCPSFLNLNLCVNNWGLSQRRKNKRAESRCPKINNVRSVKILWDDCVGMCLVGAKYQTFKYERR